MMDIEGREVNTVEQEARRLSALVPGREMFDPTCVDGDLQDARRGDRGGGRWARREEVDVKGS